MGVCSSAPIPGLRPSHCPFLRISNASQPTPSSIIDTTQRYTLLYNKSNESLGYNTPTRTLRCITAVERFKFAKFENHRQVTFRKRPFPSAVLTNGVQPLDSIDVCFDPPCPHSHQPLLASDNLDRLSQRQNYIKNSRKISFLIKIFEKFGLFKKLCYLCFQKYEDSRIRQSESNDNRTRRHPVELLAGHLL